MIHTFLYNNDKNNKKLQTQSGERAVFCIHFSRDFGIIKFQNWNKLVYQISKLEI